MSFSKRNRYISLVLLALLNILCRYPVSPHEYGTTDSFFIHGLTTSISTFGYAKWVIHPMSLAGLYPLSYGSMYPFVLSGTSGCTGLSIEYIILILGIILSIFGMLAMYLVAKEVMNNDFFALMVAFVFSLSPAFVFYTNWTATTRGIFMALLPFFIYVLIKCHEKYRYVLLLAVMLLLSTTIHRLFYLTALILVAYVCAFIISKINFPRDINYSNIYRVLILIVLIFGVFSIQSDNISRKFSEGAIEISFLNEFGLLQAHFNLLVNYVGKAGLNLFFGFLGFIYLAKTKHLTFNKTFLVLSGVFLLLVLPHRYYTPLFYLPFLSIFIGYGIVQLCSTFKHRKKFISVFVLIILLSSVLVNGYMDNHWKKIGSNSAMSDETYRTALFVKEKINATCITNEGISGCQIQAVSGMPIFPFGVITWYSPMQLIYDFEANDFNASLKPIEDLIPPPDVWYNYRGISNVKNDYQKIMYFDFNLGSVQGKLLKYNITTVVLHKPLTNHFYSYGIRDSNFIPTMKEKSSKFFDSNSEELWYLK